MRAISRAPALSGWHPKTVGNVVSNILVKLRLTDRGWATSMRQSRSRRPPGSPARAASLRVASLLSEVDVA